MGNVIIRDGTTTQVATKLTTQSHVDMLLIYIQNGCKMKATTINSRTFKQNASHAKRAALDGPVFITDRGRTAHVLLSIEFYRGLVGARESIIDLLADEEAAVVAFELANLESLTRPVSMT